MAGAQDDVAQPTADGPRVARRRGAAGSPTRGFLFADLRDYTRYVETRGAASAADLLVRYRSIVRRAVAEHEGAEIKTEGDSFYVVFPAVSDAVQCGLAISGAAANRDAEAAAEPIPVGIGIHAGETIETPDGYVGSAVNIAARICAVARPGEVLVSDTVRALTQTILPVTFEPRGRRSLKGVGEPLALFAVRAGEAGARPIRLRRLGRRGRWLSLGGIAAAVVLVFGLGLWVRLHPANALPPGPWKIGVDLPLSGDSAFRGTPMANAVKMAIDEANAAGGIGGALLAIDAKDDSGSTPSGQDPDRGAANIKALVADPEVLAVVGPNSSKVAAREIPVSNQAGLLQCSPSNSDPALTKPRFGALDLRSANPTRINYIRVAPSDDIHGPATASYAFHDHGAKTALVIDDTQEYGRQVADSFEKSFQALGGTTVRRSVNPLVDSTSTETVDVESAQAPLPGLAPASVVYFGGFTDTGAVPIRKAMVARGFGKIPLLASDALFDGSGADEKSYLNLVGTAAAGTVVAVATLPPVRADFAERYRAAFGTAPDQYAGAAYACSQVILESLRHAAEQGPSATDLREVVRAWAADPAHRFTTVLGTIGFDANGDSTQQFVTFFRVDASAADGKGDWVTAKQQDFGPAP